MGKSEINNDYGRRRLSLEDINKSNMSLPPMRNSHLLNESALDGNESALDGNESALDGEETYSSQEEPYDVFCDKGQCKVTRDGKNGTFIKQEYEFTINIDDQSTSFKIPISFHVEAERRVYPPRNQGIIDRISNWFHRRPEVEVWEQNESKIKSAIKDCNDWGSQHKKSIINDIQYTYFLLNELRIRKGFDQDLKEKCIAQMERLQEFTTNRHLSDLYSTLYVMLDKRLTEKKLGFKTTKPFFNSPFDNKTYAELEKGTKPARWSIMD